MMGIGDLTESSPKGQGHSRTVTCMGCGLEERNQQVQLRGRRPMGRKPGEMSDSLSLMIRSFPNFSQH